MAFTEIEIAEHMKVLEDSESAGVPAYTADKVFWLIGSGYFYNHPHVGRNGRIASQKHKFINLLKT